MNIRDEQLLQQYFENAMTSSEEQHFLIDLAARDDMRHAFRSQLELVKAVRRDKDAAGSVATVRNRTLAALGLSAAMLAAEDTKASAPVSSGWRTILTKPITMLIGGILIGGGAATVYMNRTEPAPTQQVRVMSSPVESPAATPSSITTGTQQQSVTEVKTEPKATASKSVRVTHTDVKPTEKTDETLPVITTGTSPEVTVKPTFKKPQ